MSRQQLLELGLSSTVIALRLRDGRLLRIHRGVYAVGHSALGWKGCATAALLAVGPSSLISHVSAAAASRLLPNAPGAIDVTVIGGDRRQRRGLRIHRVPNLDPRDVTRKEGVPITSPARTLVDLAATGHPRLDAALAEAQVLKLVTRRDLEAAMDRATDRRGLPALRRALSTTTGPTRTELERAMLRLVDDAGLPRPLVNRKVGRFEVDFLWPREKVVVETDGWQAHGHRRAFEADRARDAELHAGGYVVVRFTWRQIDTTRVLVASRLAQILASRG